MFAWNKSFCKFLKYDGKLGKSNKQEKKKKVGKEKMCCK